MEPACRIPLLSLEAAREAAAEVGVTPQLAELNIFRVLLQQPRVAKAANDLLLGLLFRSRLAHRLREFVILRIGWVTGCDYEWTQHWRIAQETFSLGAEELLALRDWRRADCFDELDRAVLEATDEILEHGRPSGETWRRLEKHLESPVERLELVAAVSTWHWVSQLVRSVEVPLESGVDSWPPDGRGPGAAPAG